MNKQEVFDIVSKHLIMQGEQSRENCDSCCRYRIEKDGKVLKCSVGCLIPDREYYEQLEYKPVCLVGKEKDGSKFIVEITVVGAIIERLYCDSNMTVEDALFLDELRGIHDWTSPKHWKNKLQKFALENGLIFNA